MFVHLISFMIPKFGSVDLWIYLCNSAGPYYRWFTKFKSYFICQDHETHTNLEFDNYENLEWNPKIIISIHFIDILEQYSNFGSNFNWTIILNSEHIKHSTMYYIPSTTGKVVILQPINLERLKKQPKYQIMSFI